MGEALDGWSFGLVSRNQVGLRNRACSIYYGQLGKAFSAWMPRKLWHIWMLSFP
jgi:hypothetical protein